MFFLVGMRVTDETVRRSKANSLYGCFKRASGVKHGLWRLYTSIQNDHEVNEEHVDEIIEELESMIESLEGLK